MNSWGLPSIVQGSLMTQSTLYWHDYQTFGVDPMRDRPVQLAGVRTDEDQNSRGR